LPALQWHHAEVTRLPDDAQVLATNEFAAVQALRVGMLAWGVQFHLEVDESTVAKWAQVPEYGEVLARAGPGGARWLHEAVADRLDVMTSAAGALLSGLVDACGADRVRA
jgi:GMP synthase-like glutamine amidotransferase